MVVLHLPVAPATIVASAAGFIIYLYKEERGY